MLYVPNEAVHFNFRVPDADGNNVTGLSWTVMAVSKDGTRVTSGTEFDSISFAEHVSGLYYEFSFTPAASSTSTYMISAKSDATIPDAFEIHLEAMSEIAAQVMDGVDIETGMSLKQAMRGVTAVLMGKVLGAAGNEVTFRDINDAVDRVVATVTTEGNRTVVTLTLGS